MIFDLVFEGGGAKGFVFTGALEEFEARGHTFGRLLGVSAGAIIATGLAAGYTAAEIREALAEQDEVGRPVFMRFLGVPPPFDRQVLATSNIRTLLDQMNLPWLPDFIEPTLDDLLLSTLVSNPLFRQIFSFVEFGGWYQADAFEDWLSRRLDSGTFNGRPRNFSGMTLQQFFAATGRELTVLAANISQSRLLVLNHETAPDLPLVSAVRMSMNVPLLWQEVLWAAEWGGYRDQELAGDAVVDGGLLSNFPIELFITENPIWMGIMGAKRTNRLIGMLIDEQLEVPGAPPLPADGVGAFLAGFRPVRRFRDLVDTATRARDKAVLELYERFVVRLPAKGFGTTEFDMSEERREALVNAGRQAMRAYLDEIEDSPPLNSAVLEGAGFTGPADDIAGRILSDW